MLSNPPHPSGHSRQRQHRRQNSTPSAFEAVKIAPLPTFTQRPPASHRRGLSLDTRRPQLAPAPATTTTPRRVYETVSISATNPGLAKSPQQKLREAQQQCPARPGSSHTTLSEQNEGDAFLISPQVTPQSRRFASGRDLFLEPYPAAFTLDRAVNGVNGDSTDPPGDFDFFGPDSALSTPTFMTFPDSSPASAFRGWISENETTSTQSRRASRRISNGIMDKVSKFEALGNGLDVSLQRPSTPNAQSATGLISQASVESSTSQEPAPLQPPSRFSGEYDESMEETLKPIRANRVDNRNSGIFQDLRLQAEAMLQTPPRANTIPMALTDQVLRTPEFMNMRNISAEFKKIERDFDSISTAPLEIPDMMPPLQCQIPGLLPQNAFENKPDFQLPSDIDSQSTVSQDGAPSPGTKSPSRRGFPHRRTESIASLTSAASIADINIEETKTETGVTIDDIAAFMEGPNPSDGKWRCLYENCQKRFGRKENIKSHVQTHLNDRQYQCPTCKKCFVRQHDLKRHAKIHTGVKPYPCECGNSFARHDALTRHRQRGMCIGAFDGVVRKVVKRGRPKKIRPDMEERRDKAERTRRKNKLTSASSASSQSGYSDCSAANSPSNEFDGLMDDDYQFPGIMEAAIPAMPSPAPTVINPTSLGVSSAPMPAPASISGSMAEVFGAGMSPSAMSSFSHTSHLSPAAAGAGANTSPAPPDTNGPSPPSPAKSVASHYTHPPTSPPELSSTSSPPPTSSSGRFFDLDSTANNSQGTGVAATGNNHDNATGLSTTIGFGPLDSDLLLQFADDDEGGGLAQLDQHHHHHHPGLIKFERFDKFERFVEDEYDPVSMFTSGDDVFFGTA